MSKPLNERYDLGTHSNTLSFRLNHLEQRILTLEESYTTFHNLYCEEGLAWTKPIEELLEKENDKLIRKWCKLQVKREIQDMIWQNHITLENMKGRKP